MDYFLKNLLVTIGVISFCIFCAYGAHVLLKSREEIVPWIEEKCNRNAHNTVAFQNLMEAFKPFTECVEEAVGNPPPNPLSDYTTFRASTRNQACYKCLDNFGKKLSPCLDEDEKYFPDFALTAFNASFVEFCGENGFNKIPEILNDVEISKCLITRLSLEHLKKQCIDTLVIYKNIVNGIYTIKKEDLCSDLRSFKGCIAQLLQELCHEDHTKTVNLIMESYLVAC